MAVGTNAFQEAPSVELSKHVTKLSKQITNIFDLKYYIDLAFKIAYSGKMGAVHLDIPKCVASSKVDTGARVISKRNFNRKYDFRVSNSMINLLDRNNISYIHRVINTSEKPIIYLGQGCVEAYNLHIANLLLKLIFLWFQLFMDVEPLMKNTNFHFSGVECTVMLRQIVLFKKQTVS